jgi:2-keto-3-deoxy-6-phosphogluconate aldolase
MSPQDLLATVERHGVVPVVEIDDVANAVLLARTLVEAGLPDIEMTLRAPRADVAARRWDDIGARARAIVTARSARAAAVTG